MESGALLGGAWVAVSGAIGFYGVLKGGGGGVGGGRVVISGVIGGLTVLISHITGVTSPLKWLISIATCKPY